ncbi:MAG TPA: TetR/AcrR family transcriptional regulator [Burkholderiales bacterium]|nr:TetR/AcrR family transcriptional regulator [Burkholderiales bacterium]
MVAAALDIIDEKGVAGLTLRKAADRAGVSHAAPMHHFGGIGGLLAAVATEGFRGLSKAMENAAAKAEDPLDALKRMGIAYVEFCARTPAFFRAMFDVRLADKRKYPSLQEACDASFELLLEGIKACQRAQVVREDDAAGLALAAWSLVHGLAALYVDGQLTAKEFTSTDASSLADLVTKQLYLGLRPS